MRPVIRRDDRDGVHRVHTVHASCRCPKLAYTTRKRAKASAKMSSRLSGEQIEAYHCYAGHCWHIGHPPKPYDRAIALGLKAAG